MNLILKIFMMSLFLVNSNAYGNDFSKYIKNLKSHMNKLLDRDEGNGGVKDISEVPMPDIPKVEVGATSVKVYDKTGNLYKQGSSFTKLSLLEKRKFRLAFIQELYRVVRGSSGSKQELIQGLNILEQGGTREGLYRSLVLGRDYNNLETFQQAPNEKLLKYTISYAIKYLGLQYEKEQVSQLNLWGIKRVIIEKTLEVMDSFKKDGVDLHHWFANLSFEMATTYPFLWSSKARKNQNINYHKVWAQKVPFQQVKSEVIVKISRVMNFLQKD